MIVYSFPQSSNQQWADHLTDSSLFTYIRKAFRFVSEKEQMREEEYQHRKVFDLKTKCKKILVRFLLEKTDLW